MLFEPGQAYKSPADEENAKKRHQPDHDQQSEGSQEGPTAEDQLLEDR